jgi:hypothetical protein
MGDNAVGNGLIFLGVDRQSRQGAARRRPCCEASSALWDLGDRPIRGVEALVRKYFEGFSTFLNKTADICDRSRDPDRRRIGSRLRALSRGENS